MQQARRAGTALVNTGGSRLVPENDCDTGMSDPPVVRGMPAFRHVCSTARVVRRGQHPCRADHFGGEPCAGSFQLLLLPADTLRVHTHRSQRVSLAQSFVAADRGTARPHLELTTTGRRRRTGHSSACYGLEHVAQLVSFPAAMRARVKVGPGAAVTRVQ